MIIAGLVLIAVVLVGALLMADRSVNSAGHNARTVSILDGFTRAVRNKPSEERTRQLLDAYLKKGEDREAVITRCVELLTEITQDKEKSKTTVDAWVSQFDRSGVTSHQV